MFTYPNKVTAVTARSLCPRPLEEQIERIAEAGVSRLILREKDLSETEYLRLAERVYEKCLLRGVDMIPHCYPSAARELGIKKLHMPLSLLTSGLCAEFGIVGTSVHSAQDALQAQSLGAAYVAAGHIFLTDCKKGLPARGLDFLAEVCRAVDIPVYAIGGINEDNMDLALKAGAAGVCVMSAMMKL